jgi:oligopeptidase A
MSDHPYIDQSFPIPWSKLTPVQLKPDILYAIAVAEQTITAIVSLPDTSLTFDSVFAALDGAKCSLTRGLRRAKALEWCVNTPEFRAAYSEVVPIVSDFESSLYLNRDLWQVVKRASDVIPSSSLSGADGKLVRDTLLTFRREGADLPAGDRLRMQNIALGLSTATQRFRDSVIASRGAFSLFVDSEADLAGIPAPAVSAAREAAASKGQPGKWCFTLDFPSVSAVLRFAECERLRREVWEAAVRIGSGEYEAAD